MEISAMAELEKDKAATDLDVLSILTQIRDRLQNMERKIDTVMGKEMTAISEDEDKALISAEGPRRRNELIVNNPEVRKMIDRAKQKLISAMSMMEFDEICKWNPERFIKGTPALTGCEAESGDESIKEKKTVSDVEAQGNGGVHNIWTEESAGETERSILGASSDDHQCEENGIDDWMEPDPDDHMSNRGRVNIMGDDLGREDCFGVDDTMAKIEMLKEAVDRMCLIAKGIDERSTDLQYHLPASSPGTEADDEEDEKA